MSKLIKSLTLNKFDYSIENVIPDNLKIKKNRVQFLEKDKTGNVLKEINYADSEGVQDKHINKYDVNGFLIEELLYDCDEQILEGYFYNRDEKGKLINKKIKFQDGSEDTEFYKYDENNNLIEKFLYDSDNFIENKEIFKYSDNKLISQEVYDTDNKLVLKNIHVYDENKLIEVNTWDSENGNIKAINKYNDKGFREKVLRYDDKNQLIEKEEYVEDEKGRLCQVIEENPYETHNIIFLFDDNDNIILQEVYNAENKLISSIERKYDDDKNILETSVSIDGQGRALSQNYKLKYEYEFYDE